MFTGLIEELGTVRRVQRNPEGRLFFIQAKKVLNQLAIGDSVAIDGTCLTVVSIGNDGFSAQAVQETIERSTLKYFMTGTIVNLERAMSADGRFGGHFVQGHVDGIGVISSVSKSGEAGTISVELNSELIKYVVGKGSIAINGISLTVASIAGHLITVAVIPVTMRDTNLHLKQKGDYVNIEVDLLAKYIERFMDGYSSHNEGIIGKIKRWGYDKKQEQL